MDTTCAATYDDATRTITWSLGNMSSKDSHKVTFQVSIDPGVEDSSGNIAAETILNVGNVKSEQTPQTPSNQVETPVVAVLGVKIVKPPVVQPQVQPEKLPFTGAPAAVQLGVGGLLLMAGAGLLLAGRRKGRA